jgi:peptidoglycan/LPS O-acetylase OafA/YrhL
MRRVYGAIEKDPGRRAAPFFGTLRPSLLAEKPLAAVPDPDDQDPLIRYGAPLAAVLLAVVLSIMVAALAAGQFDGDYSTRAAIYTGLVLWVLVGAAVMFILAHRSEGGRLSAGRVLLWTATIWLWPVFALLAWQRR